MRSPVETTTTVPEPLSTLVPRKQMFLSSTAEVTVSGSTVSNFSTGIDSPVSAPWMTKRSFAARSRTSAGIMSPAARLTTSPGTRSARGTSRGVPSRTTVAVTLIIALSFFAAESARASCTNRSETPRTTINPITMAARASPVRRDTVASSVSRMTSGLIRAFPRSAHRPCPSSLATALGPCCSSRCSASSWVKPVGRVRRLATAIPASACAAWSS